MNSKMVIKENHMFSKVFKNGRYASDDLLTVYVLKNYNRNAPSKLGISVSPKNGGAVQRNRAKRVIREAFSALYSRIPLGYLIVAVGRKPCFCRETKTASATKSMESALAKLNLIKIDVN
ncbi:MAG: ribonuclease P protein component [Oscillospiraceae bacterium]|nr:ribonuclease P protein component [Oscillospiraceae bacterium]